MARGREGSRCPLKMMTSKMSRPSSRCWWLRWWHNRMLRTGWRAILATAATTPWSLRAAPSPFQETFMSFVARGVAIVTWAVPLGIYWIHQFSLWVCQASIIKVSISSKLLLCFFSFLTLVFDMKQKKTQASEWTKQANKVGQSTSWSLSQWRHHTHRKSHPITFLNQILWQEIVTWRHS